MADFNERELRKHCLDKAIESAYNSERGESIVERAKEFENYIKGETSSKE